MEKKDCPIGIIDSGVGGISVLRELRKKLPNENYLYLSDSKNAPYGTKSVEKIAFLTENSVKKLLLYPCKAIVIACNTATAAAVDYLRKKYKDVHIIGLEPAVLPAARRFPGENILVLSTEATEKTDRFKRLLSRASEISNIVSLSAQKIVSFVEAGMQESPALSSYLRSLFAPYKSTEFSAVVLGCTHFPFAKKSIEIALSYRPTFFDGAHGAALRVHDLLKKEALFTTDFTVGSVFWLEDSFSEYGRKMTVI